MTAIPGPAGWSPSVNRALLWASGCASLRMGDGVVRSDELFIGLLLAHPDERGEVWRFLDHFGLTARDLLPDDYPVIDATALQEAAAAASGPDEDRWDSEVSSILSDAGSIAGGPAQVWHVVVALLLRTSWQDRLQSGLNRYGISARTLVDQLNSEAMQTIDLSGRETAGEQLGEWLAQRFPRRPATMASFSNDVPDPGADFVGVSEEADAFAYVIASRTLVPPLAIGLFGDWGSGKSFLMAKIRQRVSQLTALAAADPTTDEIWSNVVPIEFNAWQYVETDLWAALLSRIFDELSPEARSKLTEHGRQQRKLRAQKDDNLREQMRIESELDRLSELEKKGVEEAAEAAEHTDRVKGQVETLRDVAVRGALEGHARSTATAGVVSAIANAFEPEVAEAVQEARRLQIAAVGPAWRQRKFWSWLRLAWVVVALLAVPVLVEVLDRQGFASSTALTAALGTAAAILTPILRSAASFAEKQQKAADDATRRVEEQLSQLVKTAEDAQEVKKQAVTATRDQIEVELEKATQVAADRVDLDKMAARLNAGTVYVDFLAGRRTADDYRKRLGVVSTVSDDLRSLSGLVADFNSSPEGRLPGGPPNRIVLYIDDLDRCPPARVLEVLEAVHLLLAFPLFVVVVAVDTRWLTTALHEALPILQLKAVPGVAMPSATDYLEKIFQIPFWVEPLDDAGRQRLLRGLLLPSVGGANGVRSQQAGTAVRVGEAESVAANQMLAVHGPWLDRDAQKFTITPAELAFVEALNPLMSGTPRQVKRFVNICKLLLAMSPPLSGGDGLATERTAACFMAALHQSMPSFALHLAAAVTDSPAGSTLGSILEDLVDPVFADERARVQNWLATQPPATQPAGPFGLADATMLLKRWDVIRRLRFAEDESQAPIPEAAVKAAVP